MKFHQRYAYSSESPNEIIDVIMSCVSTVFTSILFNGEALDSIFPSRGIR